MKELPTLQQKIEQKARQKFNAWFEEIKDEFNSLLQKHHIATYDFQIVMRATDSDKLHYPFIGQFFNDDSVLKEKMKQVYLPTFVDDEIEALLKDKSLKEE